MFIITFALGTQVAEKAHADVQTALQIIGFSRKLKENQNKFIFLPLLFFYCWTLKVVKK
jgi:hypothetical protein